MTSPATFDLALPTAGPLIEELTSLVSKAAAAVQAIDAAAVTTRAKPDGSPVTDADLASQDVILGGLSHLFPGVPILSEEAGEISPSIGAIDTFLSVDPLDGTREYLAGRPEFTINVALIVGGTPVFGCIAAPALNLLWRGIVGRGAERFELTDGVTHHGPTAIRTRALPERDVVIAVSRSHLDADTERLLAQFPGARRVVCGSALKFCRLAEGSVDLYPRLGPMHEWDVAAGHAIVTAAGGNMARPDGMPLVYGQAAGGYIVPGFVAFGDRSAAERIYALATCALR